MDATPIEDRLQNLQPLEFELVRRTGKEPLFNSLMEEHHYLGYEQPVGEHLKYLGFGARAAGRLLGMVLRSASPGQSRPLHRLERGSAAPEHPLHRLQHAVPDPAVGAGGASGVAHPGAMVARNQRGLAANVRTSDLLSGNIRGSGAIPRNLLSRGQLVICWT